VTLPFIKERLRPVKGPDQKQFAEFRTRLHNGDPAVSEAARKELLTMELNEGTYNILEVASRSDLRLKKALIEVKARLDKSAVKNDRTLATHAVRVLARIGDDEARRQLEALAAGAFAAAVTSEAQGALTRLNKGDGKK
jgi:hypothetical protein